MDRWGTVFAGQLPDLLRKYALYFLDPNGTYDTHFHSSSGTPAGKDNGKTLIPLRRQRGTMYAET